MKKIVYLIFIIVVISCKKETAIVSGTGYDDWTETSHGNSASLDYSVVFNQTKVNRIDIVIGADYWSVMQNNIDSLYGTQQQGGGPFADENPIYIPCQVYFEKKQWYDVGIRYKGNSSLSFAYQQGNGKLPFRLEFNHFEDENPLIYGQSFYGFKQLSFSSAYNDLSLIRDKITPDLFREFGVPAAQTAFYAVYVDYGEGAKYFGLYTAIEVIFDSMIKAQFTNGGNCFKPDGRGAHLNDLNTVTSEFIINKTAPGVVTEVENLVSALINPIRTTNPTQWRSNLEQVLDIPQYLKYLAANTTIANWDTYGIAQHNYYLYANPADGKINWIPWDNNQSLKTTGNKTPLNFNFGNLANNQPTPSGEHTWPLIAYIYNDPVYRAQYQQYIDDFIFGVFSTPALQSRINMASTLIEPYVIGTNGEQTGYTYLNSPADFTTEISALNTYVQNRWTAADAYTP